MNFNVKFSRNEDDDQMMELLFDATEEQTEAVQRILDQEHPGAKLEKIDVLPEWAKAFLLR